MSRCTVESGHACSSNSTLGVDGVARSSSSTSVGGTSATTATTDTTWDRCGDGVRWCEMDLSDDSGAEESPSPSRGYRSQSADIVAGVDRPSSPASSVGEASATTATTATTATAEISGAGAKMNGKKCAHKPEIRNKLLPGCTDNLSFLIKNAQELSDLNMVKESVFQTEVENFLTDTDFPWTCLASVRMPDHQEAVSYGISDQDSKILGLVAIKSFQTSHTDTPLKICCGIWLQKDDPKVTRRIITQVVLQVFGKKPLFQNNDVRRNHLSLEGVEKMTEIEAEFRYFASGTNQGTPVKIDLNKALKEGGLKELQKTFERSNMKLTGTSLDFTDYADIVAFRLKKRPLNDLKVIKEKKDKDKKDKNQKDNKVCKASWLPGNLFQFNASDEALANVEWRTNLDGHIVVLLPWHDRKGSLKLREAEEALVAPVDTKRRAIYLVPKITLNPVGADPQTVEKYLSNKYKYKVLVKSGDTWENEPRKARLCLEVVGGGDGGGTCMVNFDADGEKALPQSVNVSDLRLARDLQNMSKLGEADDARTVAKSEAKSET